MEVDRRKAAAERGRTKEAARSFEQFSYYYKEKEDVEIKLYLSQQIRRIP
jgi:hypothetical protein